MSVRQTVSINPLTPLKNGVQFGKDVCAKCALNMLDTVSLHGIGGV